MIAGLVALCLLLLGCGTVFGAGEKPTLDGIFPAGAPAGSTNEITFAGKFDPWPPKIWSSNPSLAFSFSTNKGTAQLCVATNATPGPGLLRLFNEFGASDLRIFVVGDGREILEAEPNNHFSKPQVITNLPGVVNGRLEKNGDVDSFALTVKSGQWLDASLDCYTLLAKLDPVLRLLTTNGYQLAWNHDFSSLDPRIIWHAPYDGTVILQVFGFVYPADSDIRLSGNAADAYRLHLALSESPPSDVSEKLGEREPNDRAEEAQPVQLPSHTAGTISSGGDVDRYKIQIDRAQTVEVKVGANTVGSPLDAWLAVEDPKGKEIARIDDAGNSRDPLLEFTAAEAGFYVIVIGSVTHQGGSDYRYNLEVQPAAPDYRVSSVADGVTLDRGGTNTLKLKFQRLRGFTNEVALAAAHLPESVRSPRIVLPEKDGEVTVTFTTETNAPAFSGPIQLVCKDQATGNERAVHFELVSRTENNGVPGGYSKLLVESTDQLWVTIKPVEAKP